MNEVLPLEIEFRAFAEAPASVIEGALLISRLVRPETDAEWCRGELKRLGDASDGTPDSILEVLRADGFTGAQTYYATDNSALDFVLRERRGIPITLATVIMGAAESRGLIARGINFPGHFLVEIEDRLIDPFTITVIDDAERGLWAARAGASVEQAFKSASAADVVLRMLNNLKGLAVGEGDHARALEYTGYQLLITPEGLALHLERAELWRASGALAMARHELAIALSLAPDGDLKARLAERLAALEGPAPTLH